jgi:DNA polymerase-3 subunit gamma/tau
MAHKLSLPTLTRAWQMLLKGLSETRSAPMPLQAAEMVLVRLAYAADLPSPADAIKSLGSGTAPARAPSGTASAAPSSSGGSSGPRAMAVGGSGSVAASAQHSARPEPVAQQAMPGPQSFVEVVDLFLQKREAKLAALLKRQVRLVKFGEGTLEINPGKGAPSDLAGQVGKLLTQWTGQRWVVSVSNATGAPSLYDQEIDVAKSDPVVKSLLAAFPGATVEAIRRAESDS